MEFIIILIKDYFFTIISLIIIFRNNKFLPINEIT